jgi:hypothetical protein
MDTKQAWASEKIVLMLILIVRRTGVMNFFGGKLVLDVFIEKRSGRAFYFDVQLKHFPQARRHFFIPVHVSAAEFDLQRFFFIVVRHLMDG